MLTEFEFLIVRGLDWMNFRSESIRELYSGCVPIGIVFTAFVIQTKIAPETENELVNLNRPAEINRKNQVLMNSSAPAVIWIIPVAVRI